MTPHLILWIIIGALIGFALYHDIKRRRDEREWEKFKSRPHDEDDVESGGKY